jgi:8-oxo-dGTP pyrophosphatase MutT (NUDIX family)
MLREFSAGGIVIDDTRLAVIRPQGRAERHWALPKGAIDPGERGVDVAVREVREETGLVAEPLRRLEPVKYVYQRAGERIFKVVTFWVMAAVGGELGAIAEEMRVEVAEVAWVPLADAPTLLAYRGERRLVTALLAEE